MIVKNTLDKVLPPLEEKLRQFPWEEKEAYAMWLSATHQYTTHSVPLLKYAADKMVDGHLKSEMKIHISGEDGHEKIALADLKGLGFSVFPETAAIKNLYSVVYNWVDENPNLIFAYSTPLEYLSARLAPEVAERLIAKYGEKYSRFMKVHAHVDQEHTQATWETFKHFSEGDLKLIANRCRATVINYSRYIDDIWARYKQMEKKAA